MKNILIFVLLSILTTIGYSKDYFLSPLGNDKNPGSKEQPFRTIEQAQEKIRKVKTQIKEDITVYLRAGHYNLDKTIQFKPEDSGSYEAIISYVAYPGEKVTIAGSKKINSSWTHDKNGIYKCKVPKDIAQQGFNQLFVNGKRQIRARYPNYDYNNPLRDGSGYIHVADGSNHRPDEFLVFDPKTFTQKKWDNPQTGIVHAFQSHNWGNMQYKIKDIHWQKQTIYLGKGGFQLQRRHGIGKGRGSSSPFFVENIFEELDAPGEWFFDTNKHLLYYMPPDSIDIHSAFVEAVVLEHLFTFEGTIENPVHHIILDGFTLTQTSATFLKGYDDLARGDWAIHRGGTVFFNGAQNCEIRNCFFEQIGGNGVFINGFNRNICISGNKFTQSGESAVCIVGLPKAVRNYQTWDSMERRNNTGQEMDIDRTPGPKSSDYPSTCMIKNNIIHDIGIYGKQTAGVFISMSRNITVRHNTIYNVPRAAICINDGTWGGHIIEYNDIWETVRETGEHGPFNSWGRERQWRHGGTGGMDKNLVLLDAMETTIIRNNRIANYRKSISAGNWTIDLDDGSSNYHIYNNLSLGSTLKLREGYFRRVENNIHVSPVPIGWHVWPDSSEDIFVNNIVVVSGAKPGEDNPTEILFYPIRMPEHPWGKLIDRNLYWNVNTNQFLVQTRSPNEEYDWNQWLSFGYDQHSVLGDPMFIDPVSNDYRVNKNSPAIQLEFKNFPMDQFGHHQTRIIPFGGEFKDSILVEIKADKREGIVYYTLDGDDPTLASSIYKKPIVIRRSTTIKAQTFNNQKAIGFSATAEFKKVNKLNRPSWLQTLVNGHVIKNQKSTQSIKTVDWMGAQLMDIQDGDMIDAMGGFERGVLLTDVPLDSRASKMGFVTSDLITEYNGHKIDSLERFLQLIANNKDKTFKVIRGYKPIIIKPSH